MAPKKAPALTEANINRLIQERIDEAIAAKRERVRNENNLEVPPPAPTTNLATNPAPGLAAGLTTGTASRECTFAGFLKCNPTSFHVIFAAATLQDSALTWWNNQVASMGRAVANSKSWTEMKAMMTEEFCPPKEIQRMEHELWNLKVKDYNITAYTTRFNELILLCPEMVPTEKKKVEAYIRGLSDNIQGEVTSSSPTTLSRTIRMAHKLMEQKRKSKMDREAEAKKQKWESFQPKGNSGGNQNNQRNQRNNNRGDWRDNNRQYQPNYQRQGNARAMIGARNNEIDQGGPTPKLTGKELTERHLEDVSVIRDFPEVFPDDLPGLPPHRQVEFKIKFCAESHTFARSHRTIIPLKNEGFSKQLQELSEKGFIGPSSAP
ncbi:putative reverse transcriptase domain-containing protein [Tanacetum coccineum]